jgi:hypothetical protein
MDLVLQLIIVMPIVILFALIIAAFMREENQRFHSIEAAYRRRHTFLRPQARSPVQSARVQSSEQESVELDDVPRPAHHAA